MDEGIVTAAQLAEAEKGQAERGGFVGQILVEQGAITQDAIVSFLVKKCKIPHISLLDYEVSEDLMKLIPQELCMEHNLLPIDKLGKILTVAMVDPLDAEALELVRSACPDLRIKPILCNWQHFQVVARKLFGVQEEEKKQAPKEDMFSSLRLGPAPTKPKAEPAAEAPAEEPPAAETVAPEPAPPPEPPEQAKPAPPPEPPAGAAAQKAMVAFPEDEPEAIPAAIPANVLKASMREAVQEAIRGVASELRGASGGISAEQLKEILQTSVTSVVGQVQAQSAPAAAGPTALEIAEALREGVRELVNATAPAQATGPSAEELVAALRDGLRDVAGAMSQQTTAAAAAAARAEGKEEAAQALETASVAESTRAAVDAMQRAITESQALQESRFEQLIQALREGPETEEEGVSVEAFAAPLVESTRAAIEAMQQALIESQTAQEARFEQLIHALRSPAEEGEPERRTEAAVVAEINKMDLIEREIEKRKRQRYASVRSFGGEEKVAETEDDERILAAMGGEHLLKGLTFKTFFAGQINAFTYKMGEAVAAAPGGEYNPFFLYGHVGVGKTHLINAIGNHIRANHKDFRVGYLSASHFARRLEEALKDDALEAFRENYAHWDALILDDIQFLGGRVEAQEEFFHIFNVLHQESRQIIIAGDKPPDKLGLLEERLVSRFAGGIVAELKAPEMDTRVEILRHQAATSKVPVPDEILSMVAMRVPKDVRKMVGSLRKIIAYAGMVNQQVTFEMATEILSHLGVVEAA